MMQDCDEFDQLLKACQRSVLVDSDRLLLTLQDLYHFLNEKSHPLECYSCDWDEESVVHLEYYASEIYTIEIVRSSTESLSQRNIQQVIDSCVDLCGFRNALMAAIKVIRQIAISSSEKNKQSDSLVSSMNIASLASSIYHLRRILFDIENLDQILLSTTSGGVPSEHIQFQQIQNLVNILYQIPNQIANACHRTSLRLPEWSKREVFFRKLLMAPMDKIISVSESDIDEANPKIRQIFMDLLIEKMLMGNRVNEIAVAFVAAFLQYSNSDGAISIFKKQQPETYMVACILRIKSERQTARLISFLLKNIVANVEIIPSIISDSELDSLCKSECMHLLQSICLPVLQSSKTIRDAFVHMIILSPSLTTEVIETKIIVKCATLLLSMCEDSEINDDYSDSDTETDTCSSIKRSCSKYSILMNYLISTAMVWSAKRFISNTDKMQRMCISYFIECCIDFMDASSPIEYQQNGIHELLPGISNRLSVSDPDVRIEGMVIAEKIAPILGQSLKFDELDSLRGMNLSQENHVRNENALQQSRLIEKRSQKKRVQTSKMREIDPDEEYHSEDIQYGEDEEEDGFESDDSSDSEWNEENLPVYVLEDKEEDLNIVPRPYYLQECFELLTSNGEGHEDVCKVKVALVEIPILVRAKPPDLDDFAASLANELLHKENKYDLDDFVELSFSGLLALLVCAPKVTVAYLHGQLFNELAMDKRLLILSVMQTSSAELCGEAELNKMKTERR